MVSEFGNFPGVRITTAGGGITAVTIGEEEKLVLFGAADYGADGAFGGTVDSINGEASPESPEQINARQEADLYFGQGSRLAQGMKSARANGANIDFLYAVAPDRVNVSGEIGSADTGTLDNAPMYEDNVTNEEDIVNVEVTDDGALLDVQFRYDGTPETPTAEETVLINPLTGEYAADAAPDVEYSFDYKYLDWESVLGASEVQNLVNEDETAIFAPMTDADGAALTVDGVVEDMREDYQLVNIVDGAEPNDNRIETVDGDALADDYGNYQRTDAGYDPLNYDTANQSVDSDYHFRFAPVRHIDEKRTIIPSIGGLFAGNSINDPIYNETLLGISGIEQQFTRTDAENMRDEYVIPVRENGSIRVKDNLSTSSETDWERDFWRRRITDRVVLISKQIGDSIIGKINDEQTRASAERLISSEMRQLANDRLIRPNVDDEEEPNWFVDVYESTDNPNEVKIDIGFTPYGIVKRVPVSITINT